MTKQPTNVLLVVPEGTRVRYLPNRHVDQMYAVNMDAIPIANPDPWGGQIGAITGLPVYDAERFGSDQESQD